MKEKSDPEIRPDLLLSAHFRLSEFIYSRTAIKKGMDNMPPPVVVEALRSLCVNLLEPLRKGCGNHPMFILSGYRNPVLNRQVGGVSRSQHLTGEAADVYMPDLRPLLRILRSPGSPDFDQAIFYTHRNFIHLSYSSSSGNRRQLIYV